MHKPTVQISLDLTDLDTAALKKIFADYHLKKTRN